MSNFYIVKVVPGQEPIPVPDAGTFEDGKAAAEKAKALMAGGGKYQARRVAQADTEAWKARETKRMTDGTYPTKLPDAWAKLKVPDCHFLHVSPKNKTMVAYFPDVQAGILDKPVETTPGRYLGQFTHLDVTGEIAKGLIAEIDSLTDVIFAWTREDFRRVYENGPTSCMHKSAKDFGYGVDIHPAEMYAAGDLALAHFWDPKTKRASARAVCWPEKKLYGTVYGDSPRLVKGLKDLGYKALSETSKGSFPAGVRFHKIENPQRKGRYISPYLDNFACSLLDKGDIAVTLDSNFDLRKVPPGERVLSRGNYGEWVLSRICPKLGNSQPDIDDAKWQMVCGVDQEWSDQAIQQHTFTCPHTKKLWPKEDKYRMLIGGVEYSRVAAEEIGSFKCSVTRMDYLKTDLHSEEDGQMISKAGHVHRERVKRIEAERARERKRLLEERERWDKEMALVEKAAAPLSTEDKEKGAPKISKHHVVIAGMPAAEVDPNRVVYRGNHLIGDVHEELAEVA